MYVLRVLIGPLRSLHQLFYLFICCNWSEKLLWILFCYTLTASSLYEIVAIPAKYTRARENGLQRGDASRGKVPKIVVKSRDYSQSTLHSIKNSSNLRCEHPIVQQVSSFIYLPLN